MKQVEIEHRTEQGSTPGVRFRELCKSSRFAAADTHTLKSNLSLSLPPPLPYSSPLLSSDTEALANRD